MGGKSIGLDGQVNERLVRRRNQDDHLDLWFEGWYHLLQGRGKKSRVVTRLCVRGMWMIDICGTQTLE